MTKREREKGYKGERMKGRDRERYRHIDRSRDRNRMTDVSRLGGTQSAVCLTRSCNSMSMAALHLFPFKHNTDFVFS